MQAIKQEGRTFLLQNIVHLLKHFFYAGCDRERTITKATVVNSSIVFTKL